MSSHMSANGSLQPASRRAAISTRHKAHPSLDGLILPLSPPQSPKAPKRRRIPSLSADQLFELVRRYSLGESTVLEDRTFINFLVSTSEYGRFQHLLDQSSLAAWYQHHVRYDWDSETETYTLRMPTLLHEAFSRSVITEIRRQINFLAQEKSSFAPIAHKIRDWGSPSINLQSIPSSSQESDQDVHKTITRCPDGSLYYEGHAFPPTVLEVSYSQKRKDLPYIADSYIVDSEHEIQSVIGLDIQYNPPQKSSTANIDKTATVSYWEKFIQVDDKGETTGASQCLLDQDPFRSATGEALPGNFKLPLSSFLPAEVLASPARNVISGLFIDIPYPKLAEMLSEAEEAQQLLASSRERRNLDNVPSTKPKKWRKRKRTPPEELGSSQEANFAELEKKDDERADLIDSSFDSNGRTSRTRRRRV